MFFRISWPGENPAKFLFLKLNPSIDYGQTGAGAFVFLAPCRRWKEPYSLPFCRGSVRLRLRFEVARPANSNPGVPMRRTVPRASVSQWIDSQQCENKAIIMMIGIGMSMR